MNLEYAEFCLADSDFYDSPVRNRGDDRDLQLELPEGWLCSEIDDCLACRPAELEMPSQGWKIHASATLDNAARVLRAVRDTCVARQVPFKFVRSVQLLLLRNGKYADRGASGKFITIYPRDDAELEALLRELDGQIGGEAGPYVLSDLRYSSGPLYVRYGGFAERWCVGPDGEPHLAIEDPTGTLVPDRRGPTFRSPDWVPLPDFLRPHLEARQSAMVSEQPFRIERALHFSNGGGLYAGVDERLGETVVLKEARPHAGLAMDGSDAVTRLRAERDTLCRLAGLDVVPGVRDYFALGGHEFLVEDFVEGRPLSAVLIERNPVTQLDATAEDFAAYADWAVQMCRRVEEAVAAVHDRGIVIGDLHPFNVIVGSEDRLTLIDLEIAADVADARRPSLADPGFIAPPDRTGFDVDRYALGCLRLFAFLPLTTLIGLRRDKAHDLAEHIAELFPVDRDFLDEAVAVITHGRRTRTVAPEAHPAVAAVLEPTADGWRRARASMTDAILSSATPQREDRLFPGDIRQFTTGGLGIAHGAAGVLYALARTGTEPCPDHVEWLVQRATHPQPGTRLGFYDGLAGVAYVLDHLGRPDAAREVLEICVTELDRALPDLGLDLASGLAGIGLAVAHFAARTGDASLGELVGRIVDETADRLGDIEAVATTSGGTRPYAGLLRGSSGPALLCIRLYEVTGDERLLDVAATAVRQDLRRCTLRPDGALEVDEGWRTMPYLADGSIGIGIVAEEYLRHRREDDLERAVPAIRRAATSRFYIEPGLFLGRAGMILYLSEPRDRPCRAGAAPDECTAGHLAGHVRDLAWHAITYRGRLAFPGEQLLRLSMDLASGTAGVLLALGAALHPQPVGLPLVREALPVRAATTPRRSATVERR